MVKDYANLNSQSLKATVKASVSPAKKAAVSSRNTTTKSAAGNAAPLPILGTLVTVIVALVLIMAIVMAYKHRDSLMSVKVRVAMWVDTIRHHGKDKSQLDSSGRLSMDQSISDPTQSMAADSGQQTLNLPANINLNAPPPPPVKKRPKPAPAQAPQPVFDFYTVLPSGSANSTAPNDANASAQPTPPPSTTPANAQPAAKFVVDVGYYQDQQSANQLRSQLLLMGFTPTVKNTGSLTSPIYQAELGPFDTITQANQVRQQLQSSGVSNIVVHPQN